MDTGYRALTEKEKQTLRLLVNGHDAKSIARHLGLSVHTIHERLRDARRKLMVSSSREAARQLRAFEGGTPENGGDTVFGDAPQGGEAQASITGGKAGGVPRFAWLIGGTAMTIAVALYAAIALWSGGAGKVESTAMAAAAQSPAQQQAEQAARQWLALVDARDWRAAWSATGSAFRGLNTLEGWSAAVEGAHGPLGAALSRELVTADYSPAPPDGVWTIRFRTRFAKGREAIETLALSHEDDGWRVVGVMLD